jgi:predicted nucleic acid-binding protein
VSLVLDASISMKWCFEEEKTKYTEEVLDRVYESRAHVPPIWPIEISNAILLGERRNRINLTHTLRFLQLLRTLPIVVDREDMNLALGSVLVLGRAHNLTAYDASYLELAIRLGLPLATQDVQLREAAQRAGVPLI